MRVLKRAAVEVLRGDGGAELPRGSRSGGDTFYGAPSNRAFQTTCACGAAIEVTSDAIVSHAFLPDAMRTREARFDDAGCPAGFDLRCGACARPQRWIFAVHESPPWSCQLFAEVSWVYLPRDGER